MTWRDRSVIWRDKNLHAVTVVLPLSLTLSLPLHNRDLNPNRCRYRYRPASITIPSGFLYHPVLLPWPSRFYILVPTTYRTFTIYLPSIHRPSRRSGDDNGKKRDDHRSMEVRWTVGGRSVNGWWTVVKKTVTEAGRDVFVKMSIQIKDLKHTFTVTVKVPVTVRVTVTEW